MATPVSGSALSELSAPSAFVDVSGGREHVMFRAVFRELSNDRSGTHSTKRRDEVRGGGRKPWRQKGTGRARQGSTRSPQWAHGGVVFGPKPRSYEVSLNKKERRLAMRSALADRFASGAVSLLGADIVAVEKTAAFAAALFGSAKAAKVAPRTLVVYGRDEQIGVKLERVARNLPRVDVTHVGALDVKDVLGRERLVLTSAALNELTAAFGESA